MAKIIDITIRDKIARNVRGNVCEYICGNSDFVVAFDFDAEWDAFETKTARFKYNGTHQDVVFTGNQCNVPIIENTHMFKVGVFAGNLHTTTPATVMAKKSILCGSGVPAAPSDDVYNQIMEKLNSLSEVDPEAVAAAVEAYMEENPITFTEADPTVPNWAKQATKPTYTAEEVGALPDTTEIPVVPTKVSAFENDKGYLTEHQDLSGYAKTTDIPTAVSAFTNDSGYQTEAEVTALINTALGVIENGTY